MVLRAEMAASRDTRRGGYGNRERCDRPTPKIVGAVLLIAEGAVLLKSRRSTPEDVVGRYY